MLRTNRHSIKNILTCRSIHFSAQHFNQQAKAFDQLEELIRTDSFKGWTTDDRLNKNTVDLVKKLQTPMETGPFTKLRMQPDGILNDHNGFLQIQSNGKFPYKKLLKEEFWDQTVFKQIAKQRMTESKHMQSFNEESFVNGGESVTENYDLRPFDIVIDGSNLYYKLTQLKSYGYVNEHEGENDRLLKEGLDLTPEIMRIWKLLFETLFNAQSIYHNVYNSPRAYLKIAVLSKDERALTFLSELFSNNHEAKFSNIDVQCCKLPTNADDDKECIALALHEKAIVLTDDAFKDHTSEISEKNKDLFNYWMFHSQYCTSRSIYGNISSRNLTASLSRIPPVTQKMLRNMVNIPQLKTHISNWPDFYNVSLFLKRHLPDPSARMIRGNILQVPISCRNFENTLSEGNNTLGSLKKAGLSNYRLYGHTCLIKVVKGMDNQVKYDSYNRANRLDNWVNKNQEKEVLATSLMNEHGFCAFNERMLMQHPVCNIKHGKPVVPPTWRKVVKHEISNTACGKASIKVDPKFKAVLVAIDNGTVDLKGVRGNDQNNVKYITNEKDAHRFGSNIGGKVVVKINRDKEGGVSLVAKNRIVKNVVDQTGNFDKNNHNEQYEGQAYKGHRQRKTMINNLKILQ